VVGQFGQFPPFLAVIEADVSNLMTHVLNVRRWGYK